ncbi:MAG: superoxide dismutase family protein [Actinomycetota bacterium]|nr:superoxide dismutase family protein [Actinomycetota bacterium]
MSKRLAALGAVGALLALSMSMVVPAASHDGGHARVVARLRNVDGDVVAVVKMQRGDGDKVRVRAFARGVEPAGEFHGFHVHTTGECDPEAIDPATEEVVPFFSAGGHFNPDGNAHGEHAGDFPVLLVNDDGSARARFVTDRFRINELFDEDGSAVIIHEGRDNYANIPATTPTGEERYHSHLEDVFGPDSITLATGDAGSRYACGVVRR